MPEWLPPFFAGACVMWAICGLLYILESRTLKPLLQEPQPEYTERTYNLADPEQLAQYRAQLIREEWIEYV